MREPLSPRARRAVVAGTGVMISAVLPAFLTASLASRISDAVVLAGNGSRFVKYVVYYFGPTEGPYCGRGGGERDGVAVATVF